MTSARFGVVAIMLAAPLFGWSSALHGAGEPADVVEIRGAVTPLAGSIVSMSQAGVLLQLEAAESTSASASVSGEVGAQRALIGWDQVRLVRGSKAVAAEAFKPFADALWLGRFRLELGDVVMAEQLLEPLFAAPANQPPLGPSGRVLAESILRVRLLRGWTSGATEAWLSWLRARPSVSSSDGPAPRWVGGSVASSAGGGRGEMIEASMGVCPWLPPAASTAFNPGAARNIAAMDVAKFADADSVTKAMLGLYQFDARAELARMEGQAVETSLPAHVSDDAGVRLVYDIVSARWGSTEQRGLARAALERRLRAAQASGQSKAGAMPRTSDKRSEQSEVGDDADNALATARTWEVAWCQLAIGRSLLVEASIAQRRLGVAMILELPAQHATAFPLLAAVAIADASAELDAQGDVAGARRLRADLAALLPDLPEPDPGPLSAPPGGGSLPGGR